MRQSCRFRKMLKNKYLVAKIGLDTDENEPFEFSYKLKSLGREGPSMAVSGGTIRGVSN